MKTYFDSFKHIRCNMTFLWFNFNPWILIRKILPFISDSLIWIIFHFEIHFAQFLLFWQHHDVRKYQNIILNSLKTYLFKKTLTSQLYYVLFKWVHVGLNFYITFIYSRGSWLKFNIKRIKFRRLNCLFWRWN